jgi:hypothetical protein
MKPVTMRQVADLLHRLPPDKLAVVYDFASYLIGLREQSEAFQTMLASEGVLSRDWDTPKEDEAWADL